MSESEVDVDELHNTLWQLAHELEERFPDREPSEDEVQQFLRERLRAEGRSEEEIQRFMEQLPD